MVAAAGQFMYADAVAQETLSLPFEESFNTSESIQKFTILDVNNDGETWKYYTINECMRCANLFTPSDDWVLTPKFELKKGYTYRLQCKVRGSKGNLEVGMADSPDAEALKNNILVPMKDYGSELETVSVDVVCEETKEYVFGFHTTESEMFAWVDVDDILIEEIAAPEPDAARLYGTILASSSEDVVSGIYSFEVKDPIELEPVLQRTDLIANGGGCYLDGKYMMTFFMVYPNSVMTVFHSYDMETGKVTSVLGEDKSWVATDMAYDPTTGNVYCCSFSLEGGYVLSVLDQTTGRKVAVAPLDYMVALAVDNKGVLYGIDSEGTLWNINKYTAEKTLVGKTGLTGMGKLAQSATIDPETNTFYWAAANDTESGLYEVNMATAEATLLSRFPNNEHMGGIFVKKDFYNATVPAQAQKMNMVFEGGALEGVCEAMAPALYNDGSSMTENMTAYLVANGDTLAVQQGVKPGEELRLNAKVEKDGIYYFVLNFTNEEGYSRPRCVRMFVGKDTPMPVSDVKLEVLDGGKMHVTWKAPETGVNGGYIDIDGLTYDIQRYPDYTWVEEGCAANEWTDVLESDNMCTYSYGIVAVTPEGKKSDMIVSNFETVGDVLAIPFLEKFEIPQTFATYTVVDANNDDCSWIYNTQERAAIYEWSLDNLQADDWLISPKFNLEAGAIYRVGIDVRNSIYKHTERVRVALGTDVTPESMTKELIGMTTVDNSDAYTHLEQEFTADAAGLFRLGIQVCSDPGIGDLLLKNISMEKVGESSVETAKRETSRAYVDGGDLVVCNAEMEEAAVIGIDGRMITMVAAQSEQRLQLPAGVYLVRFKGHTVKVLL